MGNTKNSLKETVERISGTSVLVVGDIMLDRYVWGDVDRISQEAPVPVVEVVRDEDRLGGAGNVIRNLTNLGAKVTVCGFIGDDKEGKTVLKLLADGGAKSDGVLVDRAKPTTLKTRIIARNQQLVRLDRERRDPPDSAMREAFATLVDAQLDQNQCLIVSDYGKGAIGEELFRKLTTAKEQKRLGLGIRPFVLDPHPRNFSLYRAVSVAKPNRREAEQGANLKIRDMSTVKEAADSLLARWDSEMILISLGEDGLAILQRGSEQEGIFLQTHAREVFDVSGAGDTVTAVFSVALACGASAEIAGVLANISAGLVVSEVGTAAITKEKLLMEIESLPMER